MKQQNHSQCIQARIKQLIQLKQQNKTNANHHTQQNLISQSSHANQININSSSQPIQNQTRRPRPRTGNNSKIEVVERSVTADSSNKSEIDVRELVVDVFERGFELQKYLQKRKSTKDECITKLLQNDLFTTLLLLKLRGRERQDYEEIVQKEVIVRLQRMIALQKHERVCRMNEEKIGFLIDQRLKSLQQP